MEQTYEEAQQWNDALKNGKYARLGCSSKHSVECLAEFIDLCTRIECIEVVIETCFWSASSATDDTCTYLRGR